MRIETKMECDFAKIIHASIEGKYGSNSLSDVRKLVAESLHTFRQNNSEQSLLYSHTITTDFTSDVINQARCLYAIDVYWRFTTPDRDFTRKVHAVTCGTRLRDVKIRTDSYVPDCVDIVLWKVKDINIGLKAIAQELSRVKQFPETSVAIKGLFLAELFATFIHVHPFQDGNGRTARMLIQYCLRYWMNDYIVIPKVRNNDKWKENIKDGVQGELGGLEKYFSQRIRPR